MNVIKYKTTAVRCGEKSVITIRRWATEEKYAHMNFPSPISLGDNSVGFVEAEVDAWLEARAAERPAPVERDDVDADGNDAQGEDDDDDEDEAA